MGRKQFSRVTVLGSVESSEIVYVDYKPEGEIIIPANTTYDIDVYSPAGTFSRVNSLILEFGTPQGATTGDHEVSICPVVNEKGIYNYAKTNYLNPIEFKFMNWFGEYLEEMPNGASAQAFAVSQIVFTDDWGIRFKYKNDTDGAVELKSLYVLVERTKRQEYGGVGV